MQINIVVHLIAALVPMIIGFVWYNPKFLGNAWMTAAGMTEEKVKTGNMPLIFGLSFVLSIVLSFTYTMMMDHHFAFQAFFRPVVDHGLGVDPTSPFGSELKGLIDGYGERYSSWSHGLAHSFLVSIFVLIPIMGTNALFERRSFKYFLINWGYWAITIAVMYMIIAQFG
ncbi:MAG: DUF1761 domain-containing protein [Flavobacteriales bacterium]